MPAKMGSSHGTGFITVGEGAFDEFASSFPMFDAHLASDALAISVYRFTFSWFVFPFPASSVGFTDGGSKAMLFVQGSQGIVRVVTLVRHNFTKGSEFAFSTMVSGDLTDVFLGLPQRIMNGGCIALIRTVQGHCDNRTRSHIYRVFSLVCQVGTPVLHFRNTRIRVVWVAPVFV